MVRSSQQRQLQAGLALKSGLRLTLLDALIALRHRNHKGEIKAPFDTA